MGATKRNPGCNCCCQPCIAVKNSCSLAPVQGATVTVKSGSTVVATGTTDVSGNCCLSLSAGTYTVVVSATGYTTSTTTGVNLTCAGGATVFLNGNTIRASILVHCSGSNPPPPITVTFSQGGTSYTATATGPVSSFYTAFSPGGLSAGTWTVTATISDPRWVSPQTVPVTVGNCVTAILVFPVASAYCCLDTGATGGTEEIVSSPTLNLTDTLFGSCTLTGVIPQGSSENCSGSWTGALPNYPFARCPGGPPCPAASVPVTATLTVSFVNPSIWGLTFSWPAGGLNDCPGAAGGTDSIGAGPSSVGLNPISLSFAFPTSPHSGSNIECSMAHVTTITGP